MHDPSEDPDNIERVFRGLYAFLHLQENTQNTVQLNSKHNKTMQAYNHCIYSDYTSNIQPVEIVSQSVHIDQSLLPTWPFKEFFAAALCTRVYRPFTYTTEHILSAGEQVSCPWKL